jgi:hypothetical protein
MSRKRNIASVTVNNAECFRRRQTRKFTEMWNKRREVRGLKNLTRGNVAECEVRRTLIKRKTSAGQGFPKYITPLTLT